MTIKVLLNGAPVAGAFVTIHAPSAFGLGGINASGTTDSNGEWNPPAPGDVNLIDGTQADVAVTYQSKYGATGGVSAAFSIFTGFLSGGYWSPNPLTLNLTTTAYQVAATEQGVETSQSSSSGFLGLSTTQIALIAVAGIAIIVFAQKV